MEKIKGIKRLEGKGIKAKVIDTGRLFTTYKSFARAVGYEDAASEGFIREEKSEELDKLKTEIFDVLAKGKHEFRRYGTVYVIESNDGHRFLIQEDGIELIYPKATGLDEMDYVELHQHIGEAIGELKRRAYTAGYEQGTSDRRTVDGFREELKELGAQVTEETPQQARDRIVKLAKEEISRLEREKTEGGEYLTYREYMDGICVAVYKVSFIINRDKGAIVCLLKGSISNKVIKKGIAKCAPNDCFNVHIGKAIALRRALGLEVPEEYLNAPQPTEVRVGDVVRFIWGDSEFFVVVGQDYANKGEYHISTANNPRYLDRIIDDSREGIDE